MRLILIVAALTAFLTGCATTPQSLAVQPVQTPTRGESLHQLLERHGTVHTAYIFWLDGHTYSLRHVAVSDERWWLVFQDGWVECWATETQASPLDPEILNLGWLGRAAGLRYLADRLQQTCGNEPPFRTVQTPTSDGQLVSGEAATTTKETPGKLGPVGTVLGTVVGVALLPVALALVGVAEVIETDLEEGSSAVPDPYADAPAQLWAFENLPYPVESVVNVLGDPESRFPLPSTKVEVLAYNTESAEAAVYFGVSSGQIIWFARHDSWLQRRAESSVGTEYPGP